MGLTPNGTATLKKGMLTLNSLDMRNGTFAFNVAGGDSATLTLLGTTDGTAFLQGTSLSVDTGSNVFLGADPGPGGNQISTTSLAVSGCSLQVGHGNWADWRSDPDRRAGQDQRQRSVGREQP